MSQTVGPQNNDSDVGQTSGGGSADKASTAPRRAGLPSPPGRRIPIATWITLGIGAAFLWAAVGLEVSASDLLGLPSKMINQLQAFFPPDNFQDVITPRLGGEYRIPFGKGKRHRVAFRAGYVVI